MQLIDIDQLDPKEYIIVKGARANNLKGIDVAIPKNKLVVITGVSGSGKSSLAFDTLFAEGQRMYVESLSSYARQFLGRMEKPDVDYIKGLSPAIAIEQKVNTRNSRSTVGTSTEIYDYLKLLFARIGKTFSPISGKEVRKDTVTDVVDFILEQKEETKFIISCPIQTKKGRTLAKTIEILLQQGFSRVSVDGEIHLLEEVLEKYIDDDKDSKTTIELVIDRNTVKKEEESRFRISDSIQTAFFEGEGICYVDIVQNKKAKRYTFSDRFEEDGISFEEPSANLFSFNNPYGACRTCDGFGSVLGIDKDLVVPDKRLSVFEGAIAPWRSETMKKWLQPLLLLNSDLDFPIHRPYSDLDEEQRELLWKGSGRFKGINKFFEHLEAKTHKIQYRVLLSRYRGKTQCPDCKGSRIRKDASYVKISNTSITDLVLLPIDRTLKFFEELTLDKHDKEISKRLLVEIKNRLSYLTKVGLGYLTLNRLTSTLSGGEFQRIKLATSLGSALVGSIYVLDEPSIGLHPRDTNNLIKVLCELRDLGNTVIVVEHEEEVIRAADYIIDIGPDAGSDGGKLVFFGETSDINKKTNTYTSDYLEGLEKIELPENKRKARGFVKIIGARENNLKNLSVDFPLGLLTVITGVSGSGKSTLIKKLLYPALGKYLEDYKGELGKMDSLDGDIGEISQIEFVDQNPIGKSSRSNPVTYIKAYDHIRQLFSQLPTSVQKSYTPSFFSLNVDGGRCDACAGEGVTKIEMQFMADIFLTCESCKGKRFKSDILEVEYNDKNIADVLSLTVDEAVTFFEQKPKIVEKLKPLQDVGLGYVQLGQSSNTLSGGEAQRVKLAYYLSKGKPSGKDRVLFLFDEPTTGLHFHDINKLLKSLDALVRQGHTIIVIEHNLEVIKCADWVIDLGPDGGEKGGQLCFQGTPKELAQQKQNFTAQYLMTKF